MNWEIEKDIFNSNFSIANSRTGETILTCHCFIHNQIEFEKIKRLVALAPKMFEWIKDVSCESIRLEDKEKLVFEANEIVEQIEQTDRKYWYEIGIDIEKEGTKTIASSNTLKEIKRIAKEMKPSYPNQRLFIDKWYSVDGEHMLDNSFKSIEINI